jgi:hypothetical protein
MKGQRLRLLYTHTIPRALAKTNNVSGQPFARRSGLYPAARIELVRVRENLGIHVNEIAGCYHWSLDEAC